MVRLWLWMSLWLCYGCGFASDLVWLSVVALSVALALVWLQLAFCFRSAFD